MSGEYFPNPTFFNNERQFEEDSDLKKPSNIDKILINNVGKPITLYCSFNNKNETNKDFEGRLEYINENYVVINNIDNNKYVFIPVKYINYIVFNEKISF